MGSLFEWITDWIKEGLIDAITGQYTSIFNSVNNQVADVANQVGQTPQGWNGGVFSMIQNLSETVVIPIAGMILTFVLVYELIQMILEKNNMHEFDTFNIFKWIFKTFVATYLLTNCFTIVMAVFDVAQNVVSQSAGVINGNLDVQAALSDLKTQLEAMGMWELIGLWLETNHHGKGPVHINIPISEPLFQFTVESLPEVRVITRYQGLNVYDRDYNDLIERLNRYQKRMIIVGQMNLIYLFEKRHTKLLYKHFVWLTEHIGNQTVPGIPVKNFDAALYAMPEEKTGQMTPELLITYGGHVVSKRLKKYLRQHPPKEHWHVSADGEVVDLYGSLTTVIEMDPFEFLEKIAPLLDNRVPEYPRVWENYCKTIPEPEFGYSEMSAIGALIKALPESCALHLANSSVIRYAQLYQVPSTIEVCCNRGTSGIEGSLSTAVGYAAGSDKLNFIVIGDLSFFYDMNALWNINVRPNLRILLLNNGGGEIFHTLPGLDMSGTSHKYITAVHKTSAKGWAEERGFLYQRVENEEQLAEAMKTFTQPEAMEQPVLMEVFSNKNKDARILKDYYHQLKQK